MAINQRRRITDTEWQVIQELRKNHEALSKECEEKGIPIGDVKHYWYKGDNFSINVKAPTVTYMDVRERIIEEMKFHSPKYHPIKRKETKDNHLLVLDPADIHIGKLAVKSETGEDYNMNIAVNRVVEGVSSLLDKSVGFNIDKIMYVIGNDILHTDNPRRTTTSGTPQDRKSVV